MDNPHLTARLSEGKQPLRIILDRHRKVPPTHNIFDPEGASWLINEELELLQGNVHFIKLAFDDSFFSQIMDRLYAAKILSVIIEGGAALLNSFIEKGLWDEARVFTGTNSLDAGIAAPILNNIAPSFSSAIETDTLNVYVNKASAYQYVSGMEL